MKRGELVFTKTFKAEFSNTERHGNATFKAPAGNLMIFAHLGVCPADKMNEIRADKLLNEMGWTFQDGTTKPLKERLAELLNDARRAGQVITVDLVPNQPLRMGGYFMRGGIRPARHAETASAKPTAPDWLECQRISDLPDVDEALRGFSDDATGDNAVCVVRAVLAAGQVY